MRAWFDALSGEDGLPGLLTAARVMGFRAARDAAGGPARARSFLRRRRALAPTRLWPILRAVLLVGAGVPDRRAGERAYLDSVAEAAMRGARELERLNAAAGKIAALPGSARSRLRAAGAVAVCEPLVTGRLLARRLDVSVRPGSTLPSGWLLPACCAK